MKKQYSIEEKAGVRFTKGSKEYNISKIIQDKIDRKDYDVNLDILKDKFPDINKDNFSERDYIYCPFEYVVGILKLSDTDYNNFPEWVHTIYVIILKDTDKIKFIGRFEKESFGKDMKMDSFVILVKAVEDAISTINHEIRHAYTEYIDYKTRNLENGDDSYGSIKSNETSISRAEQITYYDKIRNDDFYNKLKKDGFLSYDYRNGPNTDNRNSYAYFVNKVLYYLTDTEMKSHMESAYNDIIKFYDNLDNLTVLPAEVYKTNAYYRMFRQLYDYISDMLKDSKKIEEWSKENNNLLGMLGAKVIADKNRRSISESDKMDMTPWLEYKKRQLRKIIGNIRTHIEDEYTESGKNIYDIEFSISCSIGFQEHITVPDISIKTNIRTAGFICYLVDMLFQNTCNSDLCDTDVVVFLKKSSHKCRCLNKNFYNKYNIMIENFCNYLIKKKTISNHKILADNLDKILHCFDGRIIIR